jgi:hypothetical protein
MRVFCLSTGRAGSTTFAMSFKHASNFTSDHESRSNIVGLERLNYPDQHIESDNRLSWFLGGLDERFGNEPIYVHLVRNEQDVVRSFENRHRSPGAIMRGFSSSILMTSRDREESEWHHIAEMYVRTVNSNIRLFLKDKTNVVVVELEDPLSGVKEIWERAGMEGDLKSALSEWSTRHNRSP